jgi:hypothetical protein
MKKRTALAFAIIPALYFYDPSLEISVVEAATHAPAQIQKIKEVKHETPSRIFTHWISSHVLGL